MHHAVLPALVALLLTGAVEAANPPAMGEAARAELAAAIGLLKTHHINRASVDWPSVEAAAYAKAAGAQSAADAYPAIWTVIAALKEKHTTMITADHMKALMADSSSDPYAKYFAGMPESLPLADRIGYLRLPTHMGNAALGQTYASALRTQLRRFHDAHVCRFIVDLRNDGGGNMAPMMFGLDALLGAPPYGYWELGDGKTMGWPLNTPPGPDPAATAPGLTDAPVAVLIGAGTVSAGEDTAMAFEGRARTRFFGAPTAGYLVANSGYDLPDGARLLVSEVYGEDRLHRPYRDTIAPDEATADGQPALDAAIAWLKAQHCARH